MICRKICICVLGIVLFAPCYLYAEDNQLIKRGIITQNEPIEIESDQMNALNDKKMVRFSGNAVATQGDKTLKADQFLLFYENEPDGRKSKETTPLDGSAEIKMIRAIGNVSSMQGERTVTGDEAVYHHRTGIIVITGNVVMREGNNVIRGCKATIYLNKNWGKIGGCEPGQNQRVHATIESQEVKKQGIY
ncbi:MAG: LptA/OstA family protein [Smithellaceae bacterium]|jgi:lipopolysaccharide export system protein LptA|nr:hypothetical protein [Syntrophaceae bacterium]MDX9815348.1 LptA/OstA family protein [Smithellaceae bacterium]OPZ54522.1 MAG: LPS-assembly protein LptD [Deltaproteobacteria bacterium ADurb.BinA014]MBP8608903.1 hypothetical protein [Syntrophaceae bacterium]HNQ18003.1 LptA/OstA family protein [Smithellaceae bacterium]